MLRLGRRYSVKLFELKNLAVVGTVLLPAGAAHMGEIQPSSVVGNWLVVGVVCIMVLVSFWLIDRHIKESISCRSNETTRSGGLTDDLIDFEAALDSTFNSKADETRRLARGALTQFAIAMFVRGPLGSTLYFFWAYQKDHDKIEKKLAKIHVDKSRGVSFTDWEGEDDNSVTENDHGGSDEETGDD